MFTTFIKRNIAFILVALVTVVFAVINSTPSLASALIPLNRFYADTVGVFFSLFPNSVFGIVVSCALAVLGLLVYLFVVSIHKLRFLKRTVIGVCVILLGFFFSFGFSYKDVSLYDKLNISIQDSDNNYYSNEQLQESLDYFISKINTISSKLTYADRQSVPDYDFQTMCDKIQQTYSANELFDCLPDTQLRVKEFAPSPFFTYQGITGMFFPWFAEINVSTAQPNASIPHTVAHEIAHSKGITNEGECNFLGFLACVTCEDDYVRYSGYRYGLVRLLNQLYSIDDSLDKTLYKSYKDKLNPVILDELAFSNEYYVKYDGVFNKINTFFNDLYLKNNGVSQGVASYSSTVKALIYYCDNLAVDK